MVVERDGTVKVLPSSPPELQSPNFLVPGERAVVKGDVMPAKSW